MVALVLLCIVGGLLVGFAGYRLLHTVLGLSGAIALGGLVEIFGSEHLHDPLMTIVMALVAAVVGWILAMAIYKVGVFCGGAFAGYFVAFYFSSGHPHATTALVLAVVAGVAASIVEKPLMSVVTAFGGSLYTVTGAALYLHATRVIGHPNFGSVTRAGQGAVHHAGWFLVWLLLGAAGSLRQLDRWKWPLWERSARTPDAKVPKGAGLAAAGLSSTLSDDVEKLQRLTSNPFFAVRLRLFRVLHLARSEAETTGNSNRADAMYKSLREVLVGPRRGELRELKDPVGFFRSAEKRLHELQRGSRGVGSLSNQQFWLGLLAIADAAEPIGHQSLLRTLSNHAVHIHSLDHAYQWLASPEGSRWSARQRQGGNQEDAGLIADALNRQPDPLSKHFFKGTVVELDYLREALATVRPSGPASAPSPGGGGRTYG